ncbi:MAG: MFS transporter [Actinomycetota bacterium]
MGRLKKRSANRRFNPTAVAVAAATASALGLSIYYGSRKLQNFDAALIGYTTAVVFLAFGVAHRYVEWTQSPPTRRYLVRGWHAFFSWTNFRRFPTMIPKALVSYLSLQTFIGKRGKVRWMSHQFLFWGVMLATAVTFPLTFGWINFRAAGSASSAYRMYVFGIGTLTFDPLSWYGWVVFHLLDIAAVLVLAGCGYFVWRRLHDREAATGQRFGYDFLPLVALIAISSTGLLLTASSLWLEGQGYEFLAITHMATVVLTLVFIPFGKFFHVIQRPASIGVDLYKQTSLARAGVFACRKCGEPVEVATFVGDLQTTMGELGLGFGEWTETCPRCKRLARGGAYLNEVKRGFSS